MSEKIYHLLKTALDKKKKEVSSKGKNYRVILSFEKISEREEFISNKKDLKIVNKFNLIPSISVKLNESQILEYSKDELVRQIEEDQQVFLSLLEINEIFELSRVKHSQISYTGKNITVGIIDDGVNYNFSSVSNVSRHNVKGSATSKMNKHAVSHGTVMASVIGNQIRDKENKVIGIAPDVNILDFEISKSTEEYYFSNILEIFDMIIQKNIQVDVLLISLITKHPSDGLDLLSLACDVISNKGITIVCPAGNSGPNANTIGSPGAAKSVFTFGVTTKDLQLADFSGRGPISDDRIKPDFCLPGIKIQVPLEGDFLIKTTGSSVAAAIGAGMVAIIKQFKPKATNQEIYDFLKNSCRSLNVDPYSQGNGMPNLVKILENLGAIHEEILPYDYLIKKSLKVSVEFIIVFILLFYFFYFFRV